MVEIIELKLYTNCFMNMDFVTHRGSRRVTGGALCDDSAPIVAGHETERRAKLSDQHFRKSLHEMEWKNSVPPHDGVSLCAKLPPRIHHRFPSERIFSLDVVTLASSNVLACRALRQYAVGVFFSYSTRCLITAE